VKDYVLVLEWMIMSSCWTGCSGGEHSSVEVRS